MTINVKTDFFIPSEHEKRVYILDLIAAQLTGLQTVKKRTALEENIITNYQPFDFSCEISQMDFEPPKTGFTQRESLGEDN